MEDLVPPLIMLVCGVKSIKMTGKSHLSLLILLV